MSSLNQLISQLTNTPDTVNFTDVMAVINDHYNYVATTFKNGSLVNEAGTNEGSCKIFAFAKLHQLSDQATLACFGQYYRDDVLAHPNGNDHGNIRNFMNSGWSGIEFDGAALTLK